MCNAYGETLWSAELALFLSRPLLGCGVESEHHKPSWVFIVHADRISVGTSTLDSLSDVDVTPLPPTDPRYYAVRFILPTFPRTVTVSHANPMARLGVMAYGLAQFTSYGYTAGFDKQSGTSHCFIPDLWEERMCVKVWIVRD